MEAGVAHVMRARESVSREACARQVGIWIRVSTEDQVKGESPEHHEHRARAYAEAKGWRVREVYNLEAVSGKSVMGHPEAIRMLQDVQSGHIEALIFSKLARLARNTRELLDFADSFRDHGADLVSLSEAIDTSSPAGRLFFTIVAAMAQWEREEIAERVAASVPIRAKLGKPLGGAAPFGFRWEKRELVIDETEAPVRRLIYELFRQERRVKRVARVLNDRGYRTRGGAKWADTSVSRLLRDPTAKGIRRANYSRSRGQGKGWDLKPSSDWVELPCPAIVEETLWNECNALLDARYKPQNRLGRKPVHLFTGYAFCECGQKLYVPWNGSRYICQACRRKIAVTDLEAVFQEQLKGFFASPQEVVRYLEQSDEELTKRVEAVAALERERTKTEAARDKIYRAYLADQLSVQAFGSEYRPLEQRIQQIDAELPRLQAEVDFLRIEAGSRDEVIAEARDLYDRWGSLLPAEKREIVETVVQRIVVSEAEVAIDLAYIPGPSEVATQRHRNSTDSWRR